MWVDHGLFEKSFYRIDYLAPAPAEVLNHDTSKLWKYSWFAGKNDAKCIFHQLASNIWKKVDIELRSSSCYTLYQIFKIAVLGVGVYIYYWKMSIEFVVGKESRILINVLVFNMMQPPLISLMNQLVQLHYVQSFLTSLDIIYVITLLLSVIPV